MWKLKAAVKHVEDMLYDGNTDKTEDLMDDDKSGER